MEYNIEVGKRIREVRKNNNMTMKELGNAVNLSEGNIQRYEAGKIKSVDINMIKSLAKALNVTPAYLLGWESEPIPDNVLELIKPIVKRKLPLLGEIACGEPIYAVEDRESYVEVGTDIQADFCLTAKGDSMTGARINDGDIIFIKSQPTVENGEIAAVVIDDEVTLKRLFYHKELKALELRPCNSKYESIFVKESDYKNIIVLGKAIAFQSDVV